MELFQLAARSRLSDSAAARLDRLLRRKPVDWVFVLEEGGRNGILPLMTLHLAEREEVPEPVRAEFLARRERVVLSNLYLVSRLFEVLDALEARGVSAIVLKGPAVATAFYPDLSLREFGDLDLLVRRSEVEAAADVLRGLGFEPWQRIEGAQRGARERIEYSRPFTRPEDGLDLDLHWDVARSYFPRSVRPDDLWSAATRVMIQNRSVRGLPPSHLLLVLCVHGAKHGPYPWPRIKWICDVAEALRRDDIDWSGTTALARGTGSRRMLLLGAALAAPLTDRLPDPLGLALEAEPRLPALAERIWEWLALGDEVSLPFLERAEVDLTVMDRRQDRIRYALRRTLLPTQHDWELARLPRGLGFLYLPLRLARLAWRYALAPGRLRRLIPGGGGAARADRGSREPGSPTSPGSET